MAAERTRRATRAKMRAKVTCRPERFSSRRRYSATACSVRAMWPRMAGSTGRSIMSMRVGVAFIMVGGALIWTTARTRLLVGGTEDGDLAGAGKFGGFGRGWLDAQARHGADAGDDLVGDGVVDDGLGEAAEDGLGLQDLAEGERVGVEPNLAGAGEVVGHAEGVGADVVAVFLEIAAGGFEAFVEGGADAVVEPGLDAEVEEGGGEDGDDDGWGDGHDAEQHDEADMEAGAGAAASTLDPDAGDAAGEDGAEHEQDDEVGEDHREDEVRAPGELHTAGEGGEGGHAQGQSEGGEDECDDLAEKGVGDAARPGEHACASGVALEVGPRAAPSGVRRVSCRGPKGAFT